MNKQLKLRIRVSQTIPEDILRSRWPKMRRLDPKLEAYVKSIINEVLRRGDEALIEFTKRFDGVEMDIEELKVSDYEIKEAYNKICEREISALKLLKERVETNELNLLRMMNLKYESYKVKIKRIVKPIESVGCYIPGGEASYPSTLIMTATPAKVAGVKRVVVCSPPNKKGGFLQRKFPLLARIRLRKPNQGGGASMKVSESITPSMLRRA